MILGLCTWFAVQQIEREVGGRRERERERRRKEGETTHRDHLTLPGGGAAVSSCVGGVEPERSAENYI